MTDLPVPVEKLSRWQARSCERATLRGVNTMRSPDYIAFGVPTRRHRQHPSRRADTINSTDLITGFRKSSAVASPRFAACGPRLYVFCVCQRGRPSANGVLHAVGRTPVERNGVRANGSGDYRLRGPGIASAWFG